jgi:hypothetical protein
MCSGSRYEVTSCSDLGKGWRITEVPLRQSFAYGKGALMAKLLMVKVRSKARSALMAQVHLR